MEAPARDAAKGDAAALLSELGGGHVPAAGLQSVAQTKQDALDLLGGVQPTKSRVDVRLLAKFTGRYQSTHAGALDEIRGGRKSSCWSWWIWPTNYRPGASGMSADFALSDEATEGFIADAYLRGCWVEMMAAVAEQLESGVPVRTLCGIDVPRVPATCELFSRVSAGNDAEIAAVCDRVRLALDAPPSPGQGRVKRSAQAESSEGRTTERLPTSAGFGATRDPTGFTICVGDIHGQLQSFRTLWSRLENKLGAEALDLPATTLADLAGAADVAADVRLRLLRYCTQVRVTFLAREGRTDSWGQMRCHREERGLSIRKLP